MSVPPDLVVIGAGLVGWMGASPGASTMKRAAHAEMHDQRLAVVGSAIRYFARRDERLDTPAGQPLGETLRQAGSAGRAGSSCSALSKGAEHGGLEPAPHGFDLGKLWHRHRLFSMRARRAGAATTCRAPFAMVIAHGRTQERPKRVTAASDRPPTSASSTVPLGEKQASVDDVFHSVAGRYDLMNDLMSGGLHRLWKDGARHRARAAAVDRAVPVIDVAGGTGDVAFAHRRALRGRD
jgi:hypothetical protein